MNAVTRVGTSPPFRPGSTSSPRIGKLRRPGSPRRRSRPIPPESRGARRARHRVRDRPTPICHRPDRVYHGPHPVCDRLHRVCDRLHRVCDRPHRARGAGTQLTLACVDAPRAGSDLAPLDPKTAPLKGKSTSVGGNCISERCQAGNDRRNIAGIAIKPTTLPARWGIAVTEPVKTEIVTQIHRIRLATDGIPFVAI